MAFWLQPSVFRNHIIAIVYDDLQYGRYYSIGFTPFPTYIPTWPSSTSTAG